MHSSMNSCGTATDVSSSTIRIAYMDAETGVGAFARQPYEPGDIILREAPYVFAQSYSTWNTSLGVKEYDNRQRCTPVELAPASSSPSTAPSSSPHDSQLTQQLMGPHLGESQAGTEALQRLRCCFGCGAPLPAFLREECVRLDCLSQLQRRLDSCNIGVVDDDDGVQAEACANPSATPRSLWDLIHSTRISQNVEAEESHVTDGAGRPMHTAATPAYVTEVDVAGTVHVVYFCSSLCAARSLQEGGKRLVLSSLEQGMRAPPLYPDTTAHPPHAVLFSFSSVTACDAEALRYPTYDTILRTAQHPTSAATRAVAWPTRLSVLSTLHAIARRCNERVWLLVLLMAKELQATLTAAPVLSDTSLERIRGWLESSIAVPFRARLEELCARYAEGAMQLLSGDQKALLRFSWQLLTWWWVLCCVETVVAQDSESRRETEDDGLSHRATASKPAAPIDEPVLTTLLRKATTQQGQLEVWLTTVLKVAEGTAFPLQLYLELYWLTNANVHMFIVVSPLYTMWCRWLAEETGKRPPAPSVSDTNDPDDTAEQTCAKTALFARLCTLFHDTDAWSANLKPSGVAASASHATPAATAKMLHATGVALYDCATKFNHSCAPNVCFQPNVGAVAASVVAVRAIAAEEELCTSYIRIEQFEDADTGRRAARQRRRHFLSTHYGFACSCARCAADEELSESDAA